MVLETLPKLIKQSEIMNDKYHAVVTNPPYMGYKGFDQVMKKYLDQNYNNYKKDLYSVFIKRCINMTKTNFFTSMITMHSWMFISSFGDARKDILSNTTIETILHLGMEAFEDVNSKVIQTVSFVLRNNNEKKYIPNCIRLVDYYYSKKAEKKIQFFNSRNQYSQMKIEDFFKIPGTPIIYWLNQSLISKFNDNTLKLGNQIELTEGIHSRNNDYFLKHWTEINFSKMSLEGYKVGKKWFPINKGGKLRKWYGNNDYVVNWENNGYELRKFRKATIGNSKNYFKSGITYTSVTTLYNTFRFFPTGFLYDVSGPSLYIFDKENELLLLGFLNSKVARYIIPMLNPTMAIQIGDIKNLPFDKISAKKYRNTINNLVEDCIKISKEEWDSYELSWDFLKHPLLSHREKTLKNSFDNRKKLYLFQFNRLKENEGKLNQIFIEIYDLKKELTVEEKDVTINMVEREQDIKSFISYAVGCMLGRYSLDQEGLVYAGGEFDEGKYQTFAVDHDNIIPITDDQYFEDDIVSRFIEFVRVTFGQDTLEENLDFIADALTKKANETSRQRIRRYFVKEFYKNHLQTYQKRPIYWLFDSGKQDGFKALIYMHRYDSGTVARVRTDYLHALQYKYEEEMARLDLIQEADVSAQEKNKAKKRKEKIQKQLLECQQYDQVIAHVANQKIEIDLDDGVKVNYAKFQNIEIPQGEGKRPLKANLLAKI